MSWQKVQIADTIIYRKMDGVKITATMYDNSLVFSDGSKLVDDHSQDCCENVYADWNAAFADNQPLEPFSTLTIRGLPGIGIRINDVFVPCYNSQNGYYSSNLMLYFYDADGKLIFTEDISHYVEDQIS